MESTHPSVLTPRARGYTLIEMLVVLAIIGLITAIAFTGENQYNRSFVLTDTGYEVAYSLLEAQALGLSSQIKGSVYGAAFGVQFAAATPASYIAYVDLVPAAPGSAASSLCPGHAARTGPEVRPGDCVLGDYTTEPTHTYKFGQAYTISNFCGATSGGTQYCAHGNGSSIDSLNISFQRPSTEAIIVGQQSGVMVGLVSAMITVLAPDGVTKRCVSVSKVGEISVGSTGCP